MLALRNIFSYVAESLEQTKDCIAEAQVRSIDSMGICQFIVNLHNKGSHGLITNQDTKFSLVGMPLITALLEANGGVLRYRPNEDMTSLELSLPLSQPADQSA